MALVEEFEKSGNLLFRRRSFIPLVLYVLATGAILIDRNEFISFQNIYWNISCFLISMAGLIIRAITIGYTPKGTSGRNTTEGQVAETINTRGIYSVVRHPLYLGNFFMWTGIILYTAIPWLIILCIAFFWIYYERIMFAEEQFIRAKFGDTFAKWAACTPAFFPAFSGWTRSELNFSMRNVLRREYSGFFAVVVSFALLNFLKNLIYYHSLYLDFKWQIGGITGLVIYLLLRSLKKWTKVLDVEGR